MKKVLLVLPVILALAIITIVGCGGGGGGNKSTPTAHSITLSKSHVQLTPGYQTMIKAAVTGGLNPERIWWQASGGTLTYGENNVIYYSAGVESGDYYIVARSYEDSTVSATCRVRIISSGVIMP